jgi:hypothetical protein
MDNKTKPWMKDQPFQRINSPSFVPPSPSLKPLDGNGNVRGTRRPGDFLVRSPLDAIARSQLIRMTPSWTTTMGTTAAEVEQEIFGKLKRSFQTWTDAPPDQWHRWYDWNFHVVPEPEFAWLRGRGNLPVEQDIPTEKEEKANPVPIIGPLLDKILGRIVGPARNVVPEQTMECEWDTGAISARPGGMFANDWSIPMTGEYVWVAGQSIYDGGHEHEEDKADGTKEFTCRTELHPCKAVAAARWEAFKFPENDHVVPAIKFMFLTHRIGGFVDFDSLRPKNGKDYEFIVDLPEMPEGDIPLTVAVGHTPEFPHNTIVLRKPEAPLVFADFGAFANANGKGPPHEGFTPDVVLLPLNDENPRRRQVKVTIPLSSLLKAHADTDYYGVVLWMGWIDPAKTEGKKVKKVTVSFVNLRKGAVNQDTGPEEWRFKAGVNGRWFQWDFTSMHNNTDHSLVQPTPVVFWLHEDDKVVISAHGAELDLVDEIYFEARTIQVNQAEIDFEKRPPLSLPPIDPLDILGTGIESLTGGFPSRDVVWSTDVDLRPPAPQDSFGAATHPVQRAVVRRLFARLWATFNDQNEPLGLIDPTYGTVVENTRNPFPIKGQDGTSKPITLLGLQTWEKGSTAELLERPRKNIQPEWIDYQLTYTITVEPQFS